LGFLTHKRLAGPEVALGDYMSQYVSQAVKDAAKVEMVKGVLWLVGGGALTGITYAMARPGGTYVVFWGALAYGGYRFLRALYYWFNPKSLMDR